MRLRILKAVGAENIYLSQFSTFGDLDRSESFFKEYSDTLWNKQCLSGIYALVDYSKVNCY
jgi:hypothetical protein